MKKQYENILKEKMAKIRELEIENELLKKRYNIPIPHEDGCSPLADIGNAPSQPQHQKKKSLKAEYLSSKIQEKEFKKLKDDFSKLLQENKSLRKENDQLRFIKEKQEVLKVQSEERNSNESHIKQILQDQIDENKKFREMLGSFIDHKHQKSIIDIKAINDQKTFKEFEAKITEILNSKSLFDQKK